MRCRVVLGLMLVFGVGVNSLCEASLLAGGGGDRFTLNFDENGNGSISWDGHGSRTLQPLADGQTPEWGYWAMLPDPNTDPGVVGNVLTFFLPTELVMTGDIRVWEPAVGRTVGRLSDLLRFTDANGALTDDSGNFLLVADRMIYYSEVEVGVPADGDLADSGIPTDIHANDGGGVNEVGSEGANGFTWAPGGATDNVYNGISDVPEPTTLIVWAALGALAITAGWWRRRKAV
jgi:hypothetical protein